MDRTYINGKGMSHLVIRVNITAVMWKFFGKIRFKKLKLTKNFWLDGMHKSCHPANGYIHF